MKLVSFQRIERASRGRIGRLLLVLVPVAFLAACDALDNVLGVESPELINAESLTDPEDVDLLVTGAIADFECALGAFIVMGGLLTDELADATPTADRWPYDRRRVRPGYDIYAESGCTGIGTYTPLSTARFSAEYVLAQLEKFSDQQVENRTDLIATAAAYSGYSHVLLGEMFCECVLLGPDLEPGGAVTPDQMFERAVERFTRAIDAGRAAGRDSIVNMALVGRARALLNLGRPQDARLSAEQVPPDFVKATTASEVSSRRENGIYDQFFGDNVTITAEFQGLTFQGVPDPRVDVFDTGRTGYFGGAIWSTTKYSSLSAPTPIATWEEAQLIIAEAELAAGNPQNAEDIINDLHARAGLPNFDGADAAEITDHLIQERSRALFLEGHRLYDAIRFELPFEPPPGTPYHASGTYGTTRCMPLPLVETANNPNI